MSDPLDDLMRLMAEGPERCTLCRQPFAHHVSIYGGVAKNGAIAIVGDCCIDRMRDVYRAVLLAGVAAAVHFQSARERIFAAAARHQASVRLGGLPIGPQEHAHCAAGPDPSQRVRNKPRGQPTRRAVGAMAWLNNLANEPPHSAA